MFATTSPRMRPRRLSSGSFSSNPDVDVNEHEDERYNEDVGPDGVLRMPSPHPASYTRPPRDSLVRQSLAVPGLEPPRQSFIPYSEFGYHPSRPPTLHQQQMYHASQDTSYVDVDENMEIDPNYGRVVTNDEEFARRSDAIPRPSRLRRFAKAMFRPFLLVKYVIPIPNFLRRKRPTTYRRGTESSGWDFRDPTPAPPSIRMQPSDDGGDGATDNVTMFLPPPSTVPATTTMIETNAGHGHDPRIERSPASSDSAHGHSRSHHSHVSRHSPSHRSAHSHREANKVNANGDTVRSSGTTRTTRTNFSVFSPAGAKESSRARSTRTYSSLSHCSSLLFQFVRLFRVMRDLYHLPWVAVPPKRIAVDFIPALASRSKYCVHRGPPQVPLSVLIAAKAARNMEPSEGKSWYTPSPQQMAKQLKRGKGTSHHQRSHSHSHSLANAYQQLYPFPEDPRVQLRFNAPTSEGQPMYMYNPALPPFPLQASPYNAQQFYMVPSPPPNHSGAHPPHTGTGGNGLRVPQPARPPSVMSFSLPTSRPGPRPVQNGSGQPQNQSPTDPNGNTGRNDVQRPPPAAQPMYMIVQASPGPPLQSYGNAYPYPYSPPWTPPQHV